MECTECKYRKQIALKRCKHFELGGDKKRKVTKSACICVVIKHCKVAVENVCDFLLLANLCKAEVGLAIVALTMSM